MKARELKQGQLFLLGEKGNAILLRRVFIDGYIKTMKAPHSGLDCIIGTNDISMMLVMVDNSVEPFEG